MARALLWNDAEGLRVLMVGVFEKIDFLVRFWELRARSEKLGDPLAPHEQLELLSLMQLVTSAGRLLPPGPVERDPGAIPAKVLGDGGLLDVEICNATSTALLVSGVRVLTAGHQVIVRIADAVTGIELSLPCRVVWVYRGSPCTMALAVDGIPARTELSSTIPAAETSIAMGSRQRLVG